MTAYGAAISLKNRIDYILHFPHFNHIDKPSLDIIKLAYNELQPLQEILRRLDKTRKNRSRKKVNGLDGRIKDKIWELEDELEFLLYQQILPQFPVDGGMEESLFSIDVECLQDDVASFIHALKDMESEYIYEVENMPPDEPISSRIGFVGNKSKMIGLSDQFEQVKEYLTVRDRKKHVYALVGTAGVGKTALAKEVFEDPEILSHFACRAWVEVGRIPQQLTQLSRGILAQLCGITLAEGDEEIGDYWKTRLEGMKCLIVLDDVWEAEVLDSLLSSLPYIKNGFLQVMLTARDRRVIATIASNYNVDDDVVRFLNEEESKALLCEKVFGDKDLCPSQLEKAAIKIANNCEGLPLLILTVAHFLSESKNRDPKYWNDVAEKRNSVFTDAFNEITEVLYPSYDYLPQYLKMPFLYIGVFPPDYETPPSRIINMLAAEGWFLDSNKKTLEVSVWECLDELCTYKNLVLFKKKSIFWYEKMNQQRKFKTCRLHCSWRHVCRGEARKNKFYHVPQRLADGSEEVVKGQRCLCLQNNILFGIKGFCNSVRLDCTRSLLFFGPYHQYPIPIHAGFKLLRELDALKLRFYTFPTEILTLVLLKYLALTCNGEIPTAISKLFNLEVLIMHPHISIKRCTSPSYVPTQIWEMQEIEHIEVFGKSLQAPNHFAILERLLTCVGVNADIGTILELSRRIPNIRKLGVQVELTPYDDHTDLLSCFGCISTLGSLETLKCSIINPVVKPWYAVPATPSSLMLPHGLQKLHLSGMGFPWEYMDVIGSLPFLQVLKFRSYAFRGSLWEAQEGSFLRLEFFLIEDTDLVYLNLRSGRLPILSYLSMKHCYKLEEFHWPSDSTRTKIELVECNPKALTCAKQFQPNPNTLIIATSSFDGKPITIELKSSEIGRGVTTRFSLTTNSITKGMGAYGAVLSLKNTIDYILHSSHFTLVDEPSPTIIQAAYDELQPLQQILERLDNTRKNRSRKKVNALDGRIKETIWDFEDLLESLLTYHLSSSQSRVWGERDLLLFSTDLQRLRDHVGSFIQRLKDMEMEYIYELENMAEDNDDDLSISSIIGSGGTKSKMIGLSDQLEEVRRTLMRKYRGKHVYVLVGMAGIGKTTIAKKIFQDPEILRNYECRAWVKVVRNPQFSQVLRGILAQLCGTPLIEGDEEIGDDLKERLEGKTCLIVLDDVWEREVLNSVISSLLAIKTGLIQILVTARDRNVIADIISKMSSCCIMEVRFLNEAESKGLLCHKVFGDKDLRQLDQAATKIANKCEGLPLMIVAVADILLKSQNKELDYWNDVAEERNSVFTDAYNEISKVLFPSYDYLPQYLKMPFLYMGVFPPDYDTPPSRIINMLATEGWFLDTNKKQSLEVSVWECLEELCLYRNLVLFNTKSIFWHVVVGGRIFWHGVVGGRMFKTCRLHSSWRHLCRGEASKNKFYHVLNGLADSSEEVIKGQRCLCLENNILFGIEEFCNSVRLNCASSTRSLLFFGPYHKFPIPIDAGFRLLRKLDALKLRFYTFPTEILALVQLKYLALTCNGELPTTIAKLFNLQVLIIHPHINIQCYGSPSDVPVQIWDMQELEHIEILGKNLVTPNHVASLEKLSTLAGLNASICTILELFKKVPCIRKLGVQIELTTYDNHNDLLSCFGSISTLGNLETLKCSIIDPEVEYDYVVPTTHSSLIFSRGLKKLHLSGTSFPWEYMDVIGSLPLLQVLKLRSYAFRGSRWKARRESFLKLEFLLVEDSDLVQWTPSSGSFLKLSYLCMKHCYDLEELHWPSDSVFAKIELVDCNPLALTCAEQLKLPPHIRLDVTASSSFY